MAIAISDHFTYGRLLRFCIPSIGMVLFTSIYVIIDGLFVSNFAGLNAFAALNLIYPFVQILSGVGFMIGAGGSALVAKTFGEGDAERAQSIFTFLMASTLVIGIILAVIGLLTVGDVAIFFGAGELLYDDCVMYGTICLIALPAFMLQNAFQAFFACAGKPKVGLYIIVAAGLINIVLDFIFIVLFGWGLYGAAVATAIGQFVGGGIPVFYFARKNTSTLRFTKCRFMGRALLKASTNGFSELMIQISLAVVAMVYNYQLMRFIGPEGVSAYGIIDYTSIVVLSVLMGFNIGSAPIISYNYGAKHDEELQNVFKRCFLIILVINIISTLVAFALSGPIAALFAGDNESFYELATYAIRCYSLAYLLVGFNSFASNLFTALNNGLVSAIIAGARAMVFESGAVIVLPLIFGSGSIWFSVVVGEAIALIMSFLFIVCLRKEYRYLPA